jgi:hypothetical protein
LNGVSTGRIFQYFFTHPPKADTIFHSRSPHEKRITASAVKHSHAYCLMDNYFYLLPETPAGIGSFISMLSKSLKIISFVV